MASPIASINQPAYQYNKDAGNSFESGMTGGAALGGFIATAGGLGASGGVFIRQHKVNADGSHSYEQSYDGRAMTTSALTIMAGAASGAAALSQVAGPGGAVAAAGLGVLANMAVGGFAIQDSRRCTARLTVIQDRLGANLGLRMRTEADPDLRVVAEVVQYCLDQQNKKYFKGIANATGVGQPIKTLWNTGVGAAKLIKGTKGLDRAQYSRKIVEIAQKPSGEAASLARELIAALVAKSYDDIMSDAVANAMKSG
jgi:hypothetical protein